MHIPGNILAGNWKAAVYVDDRCNEEQQEALLEVFTGKLGGAIADFAALIGEVVAVERIPITCTVNEGEGTLKFGDIADAELESLMGATGRRPRCTTRSSPRSPALPAYPGTAARFRRTESRHGMSDLDISGKNSVQGEFRFTN